MKFRYKGRRFDIEGFNRADHIYRMIRNSASFYELELLEYLRFVKAFGAPKDSLAIDVGANIGNHSIFFGTFLADRVLSVEPNPAVLPVLRRNLRENLKDYEVSELAVGAAEGKGEIALPNPHNVGMARVEVTEGGAGAIAIATLDSVVASFRKASGFAGPVTFLKIDVEGAELGVLRGGKGVLERDRPHVLVEAATAAHRAELSAHLAAFGYNLISEWGWHATPVLHFAHAPTRSLRAAARAYRLGVVPRYVWRAVARRVRAAVNSS